MKGLSHYEAAPFAMLFFRFLWREAPPGAPFGGAGSPNGLTEGVSCVEWHYVGRCFIHPTAPPQLRIRSAAFNRGMIATGNHDFERSAALCNTPEVEPRAAAPQAGGFYPPLQGVFLIRRAAHCPAALPPGRILSAPTEGITIPMPFGQHPTGHHGQGQSLCPGRKASPQRSGDRDCLC